MEAPDGTNEVLVDKTEAEAQTAALQLKNELAATRAILNADQLASLTDYRPRLEKEFQRLGAYFFSIDGNLNGMNIKGALFAGECMLVRAPNFEKAFRLAKEGLDSTRIMLFEHYDDTDNDMTPTIITGGRRPADRDGPLLEKNPKLRRMLAHIIGGKPWKW